MVHHQAPGVSANKEVKVRETSATHKHASVMRKGVKVCFGSLSVSDYAMTLGLYAAAWYLLSCSGNPVPNRDKVALHISAHLRTCGLSPSPIFYEFLSLGANTKHRSDVGRVWLGTGLLHL